MFSCCYFLVVPNARRELKREGRYLQFWWRGRCWKRYAWLQQWFGLGSEWLLSSILSKAMVAYSSARAARLSSVPEWHWLTSTMCFGLCAQTRAQLCYLKNKVNIFILFNKGGEKRMRINMYLLAAFSEKKEEEFHRGYNMYLHTAGLLRGLKWDQMLLT